VKNQGRLKEMLGLEVPQPSTRLAVAELNLALNGPIRPNL